MTSATLNSPRMMERICWGRCRVPFTVTHRLSGNNALFLTLTNGNSALDFVFDLVTFFYFTLVSINTIYATVPNCSDLIQIPNKASAGQMEVTRLDPYMCEEC